MLVIYLSYIHTPLAPSTFMLPQVLRGEAGSVKEPNKADSRAVIVLVLRYAWYGYTHSTVTANRSRGLQFLDGWILKTKH
jgi:hypothetical protein